LSLLWGLQQGGSVLWVEVGTRNFFWSPHRNSATFKEMLLRNRNSAIPQSHFFLSPQLEIFASAIFGAYLAVKSGRFKKKEIRGKNLVLLSL
jgi:hypothetical protein